MKVKDLVEEAYACAKEKGWHDKPATFGDRIALIHSEASEALEAFREMDKPSSDAIRERFYLSPHGKPVRYPGHFEYKNCNGDQEHLAEFVAYKPIGVWSELADIVIRVADLCGLYGIDLEEALQKKMAYNRTRSYRHGGKHL